MFILIKDQVKNSKFYTEERKLIAVKKKRQIIDKLNCRLIQWISDNPQDPGFLYEI